MENDLIIKELNNKINILQDYNNSLKNEIIKLKKNHSKQLFDLNEEYNELKKKYELLLTKIPLDKPIKTNSIKSIILEDGKYNYPDFLYIDLPDHHSNKNIICSKLFPNDYNYLISGGTDSNLILTHLTPTRNPKYNKISLKLSSPILCIDIKPIDNDIIIVGCMDGKIYIIQIIDKDDEKEMIIKSVITNDNNKYVSCIKFSNDGEYFASGSNNKICNIYDLNDINPLKSFYFNNNVECIEWYKENEILNLIIGIIDSDCLYYIQFPNYDISEISLNENNDTYVSFSVMDMKVSYDNKYLGIITDKCSIIIYLLHTNNIIWKLYNDVCDIYYNPKICWDKEGKYVICNIQSNNNIVFWSLSTQKIFYRINDNKQIIRDINLQYINDQIYLTTSSYDKSIKIYTKI